MLRSTLRILVTPTLPPHVTELFETKTREESVFSTTYTVDYYLPFKIAYALFFPVCILQTRNNSEANLGAKLYGWKPKIMPYMGQSFVWPSDYNWFSVPNTSPAFTQQQISNASLIYPWFLSLWAIGAFGSGASRTPNHNKAAVLTNMRPRETFRQVIGWKTIDIKYPTNQAREMAIKKKQFTPKNNLPLGVHAFRGRIFVALPKWKEGVPVTLGYVDKNEGTAPAITPYPDWSWHSAANCNGLTSVFRMDVDECNRLWVMDSGVVDAENTVNQACPPQIVIFNLETDKMVWRYTLPRAQVPDSSLLSNIVVEVLNNDCANAYAYLGDVFRYGLIVYSYKLNRSWRITHSYFYPDPLASDYNLDGIQFQWVDGLFGMALSNPDRGGNRLLYFHPLSSYREFSVPTYVLRNESLGFEMNQFYRVLDEARDDETAHATGSGMDRDGVLFYNRFTKSAVACWSSRTGKYTRSNQAILHQDNETLSFPNDLRVDLEPRQTVWLLSNRLHRFLYSRLNPEEVNFRIFAADAKKVVQGTVCER